MSGQQPDTLALLTTRPFAHRGLHGAGVSENGMVAFAAAIAAGFGAECDVRLSRDGVAFVFHDALLARLTGASGAIADHDADAIDRLRLADGGSVPRLAALLEQWDAELPLLIEIKVDGRQVGRVCAAVSYDLARHPDVPATVMSFNPVAIRWLARHRPMQVRGLVISAKRRGWRGRIGQALALWAARPDFIACDIRDLPSPLSARCRQRGLPVLTWTVRTEAERARAALHADQIIFEAPHD